jgi:threonine dehydrogenase-like Zn-dependent dehydrogenase
MAASSSMLRGAAKVMLVDHHPDRLRLAEQVGVIPIDESKESPVERVLAETRGYGADKDCECAGYQAHDPQEQERPAAGKGAGIAMTRRD